MLSGICRRRACSAWTCAFVRGQSIESASKATMRRAMLSSLLDGGLPRLQLASSRLLAMVTINAAKIGELTASATMQIMINIATTPLRPFAGHRRRRSWLAIADSQGAVLKTSQ
jgi:hypothetical protein